ncbi:hypothetical protein [Nocardia flavorosea]|uniref:hypothetical protein n=1 Tax=Nocardia flavorosea TaxID=53429 RepID=UPI002453AF07|nr:hypothetical protein [Nocardia flavorosea]
MSAETGLSATETDEQGGAGVVGTPGVEQEAQADVDAGTTTDEGEDNPNREAARWRTKLRAAESERDALVEQVQTLQHSMIESALGDRMSTKAFFAVNELSDVLTEQGTVDADKLTAAIARTEDELGLGARRPEPHPFIAHGQGASGADAGAQWAASFAPKARR